LKFHVKEAELFLKRLSSFSGKNFIFFRNHESVFSDFDKFAVQA